MGLCPKGKNKFYLKDLKLFQFNHDWLIFNIAPFMEILMQVSVPPCRNNNKNETRPVTVSYR